MLVTRLCGEAGRDTDSAQYELLMLERNEERQKRVLKLTNDSKMLDLAGTPIDRAAYYKRAEEIRADLREFMAETMRKHPAGTRQ